MGRQQGSTRETNFKATLWHALRAAAFLRMTELLPKPRAGSKTPTTPGRRGRGSSDRCHKNKIKSARVLFSAALSSTAVAHQSQLSWRAGNSSPMEPLPGFNNSAKESRWDSCAWALKPSKNGSARGPRREIPALFWKHFFKVTARAAGNYPGLWFSCASFSPFPTPFYLKYKGATVISCYLGLLKKTETIQVTTKTLMLFSDANWTEHSQQSWGRLGRTCDV